jgi:hypothetical protein
MANSAVKKEKTHFASKRSNFPPIKNIVGFCKQITIPVLH